MSPIDFVIIFAVIYPTLPSRGNRGLWFGIITLMILILKSYLSYC